MFFVGLGLAALAIAPSADGIVVADLYHAALHCFFGITLLVFSYRDQSQAGGAVLFVALLCMTWTLAGYRLADGNSGDNRLHGVLSLVLASAAAFNMLKQPPRSSRPA